MHLVHEINVFWKIKHFLRKEVLSFNSKFQRIKFLRIQFESFKKHIFIKFLGLIGFWRYYWFLHFRQWRVDFRIVLWDFSFIHFVKCLLLLQFNLNSFFVFYFLFLSLLLFLLLFKFSLFYLLLKLFSQLLLSLQFLLLKLEILIQSLI